MKHVKLVVELTVHSAYPAEVVVTGMKGAAAKIVRLITTQILDNTNALNAPPDAPNATAQLASHVWMTGRSTLRVVVFHTEVTDVIQVMLHKSQLNRIKTRSSFLFSRIKLVIACRSILRGRSL